MADQEVIKHTKKIYKIWNSDEHSLFHKIKEFVIEILIIVFAVTLSIRLHDNSEHNHQQEEVKEFLLGLREDLQSDLTEIGNDTVSYHRQADALQYFSSLRKGEPAQPDSLRRHLGIMMSLIRLNQNNGRFEGFKSSGKLGSIEDTKLQNEIMDLYQENIPMLLASTDFYLSKKEKLTDFIIRERRRTTDSTDNLDLILGYDEAHNIYGQLGYTDEILHRYRVCGERMKSIIARVDALYKD